LGKELVLGAERLTRTIRGFKMVGFEYSPDDYITRRKDQKEENQIFQREYGPAFEPS
jgi:hypothetical protein